MKSIRLIACFAFSSTLAACGGGGSSTGNSVLTGVFLDSAVSGLSYATQTQTGITNDDGEFRYLAGETITFSIGSAQLPAVDAKAQITPVDIAAGSENTEDMISNIARLLQSLDEDGDPDNGIEVPENATASTTSINFDVSADEFSNDPSVINLVANSGSVTTSLISADQAMAHLNTTLGVTNNGGSADIPTDFSFDLLRERFLVPTLPDFTSGDTAYFFDTDSTTQIMDRGDQDGVLRNGSFPWRVNGGGVLTVDFNSIQDGQECSYEILSVSDSIINSSVSCLVAIEDQTRAFYLSQDLNTSDLEGRLLTFDTGESIDFVSQDEIAIIEADGTSFSTGISSIQGNYVLTDNGDSKTYLMLLDGTVDNGLFVIWDINTDRNLRVRYLQNSGGQLQTLGDFDRQL